MQQAVQPVQPAIPFKRDDAGAGSAIASGGAGVLIISLIAIAAVLLIRKKLRLGQPAAGQPSMLRVLESQRLGPRALVSVVEFKGTHYLLAQSEQGVNCIASSPAGEAS